jgi:ParB/RepB/Spo0J family partition protein
MPSLRDLASRRGEMLYLDPKLIKVKPGFNFREDTPDYLERVNEIKNSIREIGVKTPLEVYLEDGEVYVTAGHTRLRACLELIDEGVEILAIPVINEVKGTSETDRILNLFISNDVNKPTQLEQANIFKRLIGLGWSQTDVATKTGLSLSHVGNILTLGSVPEVIKELIRNDEIAPTLVTEIIKKEGNTEGTKTVLEGKKAVDEINKSIDKHIRGTRKTAKITKKVIEEAKSVKSPPSGKNERKEVKEICRELAFCADKLLAVLTKIYPDNKGYRSEFEALDWAVGRAKKAYILEARVSKEAEHNLLDISNLD